MRFKGWNILPNFE